MHRKTKASKKKPNTLTQRYAALTRSARNNDGFISQRDLDTQRISRAATKRLLDQRLLERVSPGWYRSTSLTWSFEAQIRRAGLWAARADGGLAGTTSLWWQGVGDRPLKIQIAIPKGRTTAAPKLQIRSLTDLAGSDLRIHKKIQITRVERSIVDAAAFLSEAQLHELISTAVRLNLTTNELVGYRMLELAKHGRPGIGRLRRVMATRHERFGPEANSFERDFENIVDTGSFPMPVRQYVVIVDGKRFFLDFAWPQYKAFAECDSMVAHSSQEALAADLERQNRIIEATGWRPLRVTYRDVHDRPGYVTERLEALFT